MKKCSKLFLFLIFYCLYYCTICAAIEYSCSHDESLLLLEFKQSFNILPQSDCDPSYFKTESWNKSTDCCSWEGVSCDKITGQVVELDLSCAHLSGTIDSNNSLFQLSHLQRLNLANNDIKSSQMSKILGNLTHLTHLNLSRTLFSGQVPSEILKLTELISLDLSVIYFTQFTVPADIFKLLLTNFTKLSQVSLTGCDILSSIPNNLSSSLEIIELGFNQFQDELPQSIFHHPNLKILDLGDNSQLYGILPSVEWNSYATLEWLDLSGTSMSGEIPDSFRNLKALRYLDLSYCGFNGSLPKEIFSYMTQIDTIDLSGNRLIGYLPSFSGERKYLTKFSVAGNSLTGTIMASGILLCSSLKIVDLGFNKLNGPIPTELSSLVNLNWLDLSSNNFSGHLDLDIFSNMKQLFHLRLSHNRLALARKNYSTLPESIESLRLASCNVTTLEFIITPPRYVDLDLSMNDIQELPSWLWPKSDHINFLNLSYNSITHTGEIAFQRVVFLDLRSNMFHGPFPEVPNVEFLFISNNNFFGVIPPSIICRALFLQVIDLSNNNFTGSIPQCIGNLSEDLTVLDMSMNKFEGVVPTNFSSQRLETINLHGNQLQGNIPSSLAKCINLTVLDLGNNHLNDSFPSWLGDLPKLQVLSLRSNNLYGRISISTATSFLSLQILDISHNQFIGTLQPNLFENFKGMMKINETSESSNYIGYELYLGSYLGSDAYYMDSTVVVNKGVEVELVRILKTWNSIDLSSNKFEGEIPSSVGSLNSVRQLNFSNNRFAGEIDTISLGNLSVLESLDLSSNQLVGAIPTHLATLHFLSKLNLSHNQLSGRIPGGPQFQNLDNDSFIGNDGLCGPPLSKKCVGDDVPVVDLHSPEEEDDSDFIDGFSWRSVLTCYGAGMVFGLGIGCLMMVTAKPTWLIRIVEEEGYNLVMKRNRKKKILRQIGRNN